MLLENTSAVEYEREEKRTRRREKERVRTEGVSCEMVVVCG